MLLESFERCLRKSHGTILKCYDETRLEPQLESSYFTVLGGYIGLLSKPCISADFEVKNILFSKV